MPDQAAAAVREARRAAVGESGTLRIGFTGSAALNPLIPRLIRAFQRRHPAVELLLSEDNSAALAAALRVGELDLVLLRPPAGGAGDVVTVALPDEPMIVALPGDHEVAASERGRTVALASLRDEVFILPPRDRGPALFDAAVGACVAAGFAPRLTRTAPQLASVLALVAAGQGVSIVPSYMRQLVLDGVSYHDIADARPVAPLAMVHPRENRSAVVDNFVAVVREVVP